MLSQAFAAGAALVDKAGRPRQGSKMPLCRLVEVQNIDDFPD